MKSGSIKWDDEDGTNKNSKGGTLPNGTFDDDTLIVYCCQDQGRWSDSIELPLDKPFYLLPHNSRNCQRVKGAKTTLEYIIYDTENDNNYDDFSQSHVFTNKVKLKVFLEFTTVITKVRYVHAFCNIDIYIT